MTRYQAEIRTYHLPDDDRMRDVISHCRGLCPPKCYGAKLTTTLALFTKRVIGLDKKISQCPTPATNLTLYIL